MLENQSCLLDWSPKELSDLKAQLKKLQEAQPCNIKKKRPIITGLKGCHYHKMQGCYIVNIIKDKKKIYAGRMKEWDREKALEIQAKAEAKWTEQQKIISQEID